MPLVAVIEMRGERLMGIPDLSGLGDKESYGMPARERIVTSAY